MSWTQWLFIGLVSVLGAAMNYVRILRARGREQDREIQHLRTREQTPTTSCGVFGHHLDEACLCTRCLGAQHDYKLIDSRTTCLGSELVNPDADPGALLPVHQLQPDADYGKTHTIYRVERTYRCARCTKENMTVDEEKVRDDP